ncbi:hypothetical protein [Paenibacillus tyrfis]|nr:hypothetical protein [Paenibacillus tyrfis]
MIMKPHPHGSSGLIGSEPAERQEDASEAGTLPVTKHLTLRMKR